MSIRIHEPPVNLWRRADYKNVGKFEGHRDSLLTTISFPARSKISYTHLNMYTQDLITTPINILIHEPPVDLWRRADHKDVKKFEERRNSLLTSISSTAERIISYTHLNIYTQELITTPMSILIHEPPADPSHRVDRKADRFTLTFYFPKCKMAAHQ